MAAARAPASRRSSVSVETGAHAASNAAAVSGAMTLSPKGPSARSSAFSTTAPPVVVAVLVAVLDVVALLQLERVRRREPVGRRERSGLDRRLHAGAGRRSG